MPDIPYRPRVKLGSLRSTSKKMMAPKVGGGSVGDEKLKKFFKEDKGMRRMAYGEKGSTIESWRGRHFIKDVKEKVRGSSEYKETLYSKKTTAAQEFRDTIRQEIHQEQAQQPKGPTKEEQARMKRTEAAKKEFHQYQRSKEIEQEQGKPLSGAAVTDPKAQKTSRDDSHAPSQQSTSSTTARATPLVGGGGFRKLGHDGAGKSATASASIAAPSAPETTTAQSLPSLFGFRARIMRVDVPNQALLTHILNAPPELAVFIGRDRTIIVPIETQCWEDRHPVALTDLAVGDHVDVRGRVVNEEFVADEVLVNNGELPNFVSQLQGGGSPEDSTSEPPVDLAIG